jgi:cytidine deaminase
MLFSHLEDSQNLNKGVSSILRPRPRIAKLRKANPPTSFALPLSNPYHLSPTAMNPPSAISESEQNELLLMAKHACENAYAPYSNFRVGAAILLASGEIFYGCNVENASYGLTNCAERTAIFSAVAALGAKQVRIRAVAVVNDRRVACSPCGACRQVITEFGPDAEIFYLGPSGIEQSSMQELLPHCFGSDSLA